MEVKKIVEGMTAPEVAQVIDENFKALNNEKANKSVVDAKFELLVNMSNQLETEKADKATTEENFANLEETIATNKESADTKLSELGSEVIKGGKTMSFVGISNNTGATILTNVEKGSKILVTIINSTSDSALYLQGFDKDGKLVRFTNYQKIGEVVKIVTEDFFRNIFMSNYCGVNIDIEIEVLYRPLAEISEVRGEVDANKTEISKIKSSVDNEILPSLDHYIKGYNVSYDNIAENISIPIGTKLINKGVYLICFNSDKSQRLDVQPERTYITTFEITFIQGEETEGEVYLEVEGTISKAFNYKLDEVKLVSAIKSNSITSLKDISKVNGLLTSSGNITAGADTHYYHTYPIFLRQGQSIVYRGYTFRGYGAKIFNLVEEDGTFIKPINAINQKQTENNDYSREYVSIYTATNDCYIIANLYIPSDSDWDLVSVYIGTLYDLWKNFETERKNTDNQIESTNAEIAKVNERCDTFDTHIDNTYKKLTLVRFEEGCYINNTGGINMSADLHYHADTTFHKLGSYIFAPKIGMGNNLPIIAFYDENKQFIDKIYNHAGSTSPIEIRITKEDYPLGSVFCRFAYYGSTTPIIETDNSIINTLEGKIESTETDLRVIDYSKDGGLFINGGYISMSGSLSSNSDYSATGFIEIPVLKDIELVQCQVGNKYMAAIAFYDEGKNFISALQNIGNTQVGNAVITKEQIPSNTRYIRVSGVYSETKYVSFVNYYTLPKEYLEGDNKKEVIVRNNTFKAFATTKELKPNEMVNLPSNKVKLNSLLSVTIEGVVECINIGVGYSDTTSKRTYDGRWIELTPTQVKLYGYYNADNVLHSTYNHNLELTNKTFISIATDIPTVEKNATTKIVISNDRGDTWEQSLNWGQGAAFVENKNTNNDINVVIQFMPRDITKKIWVFGDSYFGYWPTYLYNLGLNRWLRNSQPGSSPSAGYSELQNLLSLGYTPNYILWCLGMNGNTSESKVDGKYVINDYQKTNIDAVKALCEKHGIELVLMAVPTVPSRQKTGFREYVQSLGVRYIDTYKAVGADEYGVWHGKPTLRAWKNGDTFVYTQIIGDGHGFVSVNDKTFTSDGNYTGNDISEVGDSNSYIVVNGVTYSRAENEDILGLLSNDGVHPTSIGAKVIAYSVISEFAEIGLFE